MKTPDRESLEERMLAAEMAIDAALRADFGADSCVTLAQCLSALINLVFDADDELPIGIEDDSAITTKILTMVDVAYCCWKNDGSELELPDDAFMNHIVRMKLNPKYCKTVLDYTRMFLDKYDRLLSVASASLRIP